MIRASALAEDRGSRARRGARMLRRPLRRARSSPSTKIGGGGNGHNVVLDQLVRVLLYIDQFDLETGVLGFQTTDRSCHSSAWTENGVAEENELGVTCHSGRGCSLAPNCVRG